MWGWNLSQSHPFSLDKLQQVYVNSSKRRKKEGVKKEKSPTRLLSRKSSRAPLEERARASRKSSFLRNLRLFEQAESRTTHELDYVKCEKRAGSETK
jgi:hypothetical protein